MRYELTLTAAFLAAPLNPAAAQQPAAGQPQEGVAVHAPGIEKLEIGGEARLRWESRDPVPPVTGGLSESDAIGRFRVHLDATVDELLSGFVQFQETVMSQGTPSADFLRQGFLYLRDIYEILDLQAGRFEMSYGNQRMVSPLDWSPVGRAWDGVRAVARRDQWQADLFYTQPVEGMAVAPGADQTFAALYGQWNGNPVSVDAYVFRRQETGVFADFTWGALVDGAHDSLSWNVEGALQTGDHGTLSAGGYAVAARVDWTFEEGGPKVGLGYELASGDSDPADGDDDTFRRLFNFDHAWQGYMDLVVWQNVQDIVVRGWIPVGAGWGVSGDVHLLSLAENNDFIYTGNGFPAVGGVVAPTADDTIGTEVDVTLRGKLSEKLDVWAGVGQLFAGDAIPAGDDQTWVFVQGTLAF